MLLLVQGITKFLAVFSLWRLGYAELTGGRTELALAAVFGVVWCILNEVLERRLLNERAFYERTVKRWKEGGAAAVYCVLIWFFIAQISVFLRFSYVSLLDIRNLISGGDGSWISIPGLPALTAVAVSSGLTLRTLCGRLWEKWLRQYVTANLFWWTAALLALTMAAGYRDAYAAAGFYFAYNWQILLSGASVYAVLSAKSGKKGL